MAVVAPPDIFINPLNALTSASSPPNSWLRLESIVHVPDDTVGTPVELDVLMPVPPLAAGSIPETSVPSATAPAWIVVDPVLDIKTSPDIPTLVHALLPLATRIFPLVAVVVPSVAPFILATVGELPVPLKSPPQLVDVVRSLLAFWSQLDASKNSSPSGVALTLTK